MLKPNFPVLTVLLLACFLWLSSFAIAATSPSSPRVFYIDASGKLMSADTWGGDAKEEYDPGVNRRWKVADFDLRTQGDKAIVVAIQMGQPQDGYSPRERCDQMILDLQSHTTETLTLDAFNPKYIAQPLLRWSPDGNKIAYINSYEIWVHDTEKKTTDQASHLFVPDTSPRHHGSRWNSVVLDFAWITPTQIAAWNGRHSGSGIAYISLVDLVANRNKRLSPEDCWNPSPGPGGSLAWVRRNDGGRIQKIQLCTSYKNDAPVVQDVEGTSGASFKEPFAWSADGRFLAFVAQQDLSIIDSSSGQMLYAVDGGSRPYWIEEDVLAQTKEGIVRLNPHEKKLKLIIPGASLPDKANCLLNITE